MPWIKQEDCTRCGICIDECPVDAIVMEDAGARIIDDECIRCGKCHDVCVVDAVKHDSERIPQDVEENMRWTMNLLKYYSTDAERAEFIERIRKHFMKTKRVAELSLEKLDSIRW